MNTGIRGGPDGPARRRGSGSVAHFLEGLAGGLVQILLGEDHRQHAEDEERPVGDGRRPFDDVGEEQHDKEVDEEVGARGQGHGAAADLVREHLAHHHREDRTPGGGEAEQEAAQGSDGEEAEHGAVADVGAIGTARSDGEDGGDHGQRDEDQRAAVHQHALAADAVDQQDARGHTDDLEDGQDQCLLEGRGLRDADRFEQGVGVEEDAVGAGQLLEGGERHAHADEATPLRTQYGEDAKGLVDAAERALDGLPAR